MLITLPSALRLLLIAAPSFSRSPVAPVLDARSEPARSTRLILAFMHVSFCTPASTCDRFDEILIVKQLCERELRSFICVAATCRTLLPCSSSRVTSAGSRTTSSANCST
ncbi:hypothetical protein PF003_g4196 [Phytophthora fragariae]|nr:hypothetical protein PF003_g4196 [Phytophthora fragariae]